MRFSYNKLWKLLIDRDIKKKELGEMANVSATTIAKLGNGGNVNTKALLEICNVLHCDIGDIMEFVPDDEPTDKVSSNAHKEAEI